VGGQEGRRAGGIHSLMDSAVTIEITQAEADIVPVLGDVGRRAPHVPVHANIVQGVWASQPAKDKTWGCYCEPGNQITSTKRLCFRKAKASSWRSLW
jgi:hypothetical protein